MQHVLIMGTVRSGISALLDVFTASGFYDLDWGFPDGQLSPTNKVNNALISQVMEAQIWNFEKQTEWLAVLYRDVVLPKLQEAPYPRYRELFKEKPLCLKDPRFSFTLPAWSEWIPADTQKIVMFRHPVDYLRSIWAGINDKQWETTKNAEAMCRSWNSHYEHIMAQDDGSFIYLPLDSLVNGKAFQLLSGYFGDLRKEKIDQNLIHQQSDSISVPYICRPVWQGLNAKWSNYKL